MQTAGLEQSDLQRQFGNLLGTNQFRLGAEGQMANQILNQNQQNLGAYQQNFGNQMGLAGQMFNAGNAGEQRNQNLWSQLTGQAGQGMNYNDQLLSQIINQRQGQIAPMVAPSPSQFVPMGGGGGGGGGGNSWLPQLAQVAGQFAGSYM
jgi:hypothetical protein